MLVDVQQWHMPIRDGQPHWCECGHRRSAHWSLVVWCEAPNCTCIRFKELYYPPGAL